MNWTTVLQEIIAVLFPIVMGVVAFFVKKLTKAMKENENTVIHTLGELAYREIERNMEGVGGQEKMAAAIEQVRARLDKNGHLAKVSNEVIIEAIQKAWHQNEGQYK